MNVKTIDALLWSTAIPTAVLPAEMQAASMAEIREWLKNEKNRLGTSIPAGL